MLSNEENRIVTRVGPGTPMGETMRRYWLPALLASEVADADGPPVRVRLLGEDLVAFRDTQGRIGLLDELCPHRLASLYFGRNEECGLRCVYHGWKFDVSGACTDMMNEQEAQDFKHKIHIKTYPTIELGGLIWAYMGPAEKMPPAPKFAWTQVPEARRHVTKVIQESNWLQGLEGGLDTSHAPIMHRALTETTTRGGFKPSNPFVRGKAPKLVVDLTDYGYQYSGIRELGPDDVHIRAYHFILPFHQIRPSKSESGAPMDAGHCWVPMDDETTMVFNWVFSKDGTALNEEDRLERSLGNGPLHVDQKTFRSHANKANDYLIDRVVQKAETFTGIEGINAQDRAIQESMGKIVDRSREHLGPADKAIIQARKKLRDAIRAVESGGSPEGLGTTYYSLVAEEGVLAKDADWRTELTRHMRPEAILQTV